MQIGHKALDGLDGHTAGRQLLADMYWKITGQPLPQIRVADRGKPYFEGSPLQFSISHTENHVFCVLSDKPVGVDAEKTDRQIDLRLADKILSPAEKIRYDRAADKRTALLKLWVLKESYAKATGRGWGRYLHETDFDPDDPRVQEMDGCYVAVIDN